MKTLFHNLLDIVILSLYVLLTLLPVSIGTLLLVFAVNAQGNYTSIIDILIHILMGVALVIIYIGVRFIIYVYHDILKDNEPRYKHDS